MAERTPDSAPRRGARTLHNTKNPHAVILGRRGGKAGRGKCKARTTKQARAAVLARWEKEGRQ